MNHTVTAQRTGHSRGRWSALNIFIMVIGFALFWPLGLAMLAYIVWGDEIGRLTADLKAQASSLTSGFSKRSVGFSPDTGNVAFDEYRTRELARIEEERRKLDEMRGEFEGFVKELRRVKDQEEFDRFLGEFRKHGSTHGETNTTV